MPKVYVSLCSKIDGLNVITVNFTIGDAQYKLDCKPTHYEASFYGTTLDGVDTLQFVKFLQKVFDNVEGTNV